MGLHDLIQGLGRCVSAMPYVPCAHRSETVAIIIACHEMSLEVQKPGKEFQAEIALKVIEVTEKALMTIAEPSRSKKRAKPTELVAYEDLLKNCTEQLVSVMNPEKAKEFQVTIERATTKDKDKAAQLKKASKVVKERCRTLFTAPKAHLEFWVWDTYASQEGSIAHRPTMTFEVDTSMSVVWAYFLSFMKHDLTVASNPLLYSKFNLLKLTDFEEKSQVVRPISFEHSLGVLVSNSKNSSSKPLVLHVLTNRRSCISFQLDPIPLTIGNVFRLDNLTILREKSGPLHHEKDVKKRLGVTSNLMKPDNEGIDLWWSKAEIWNDRRPWKFMHEIMGEDAAAGDDGTLWKCLPALRPSSPVPPIGVPVPSVQSVPLFSEEAGASDNPPYRRQPVRHSPPAMDSNFSLVLRMPSPTTVRDTTRMKLPLSGPTYLSPSTTSVDAMDSQRESRTLESVVERAPVGNHVKERAIVRGTSLLVEPEPVPPPSPALGNPQGVNRATSSLSASEVNAPITTASHPAAPRHPAPNGRTDQGKARAVPHSVPPLSIKPTLPTINTVRRDTASSSRRMFHDSGIRMEPPTLGVPKVDAFVFKPAAPAVPATPATPLAPSTPSNRYTSWFKSIKKVVGL